MDKKLILVLGFCIWNNVQGIPEVQIKYEDGFIVPARLDVIEGHDITLVCRATGNVSLASIEWTRQGDPNFIVKSETILLVNLRLVDDDTYTCTARTYQKEVLEDFFELNVLYQPSRPVITGPKLVEVGTEYQLNCSSDSNPEATYVWTYHNEVGGAVQGRGAVYRYTNHLSWDRDVFCWASVTLVPTRGTPVPYDVSDYFKVTILAPAYVSPFDNDKRFVTQSTVKITCETSGFPTPTVKWTKKDEANFRQDGNVLFFKSIQRSDAGVYTCQAENTLLPSNQDGRWIVDAKSIVITVDDPTYPDDCKEFFAKENGCNVTSSPDVTTACNNLCKQTFGHAPQANQSTPTVGLIVAAVVGWCVAVILFLIGLFYCVRKRDKSNDRKTPVEPNKIEYVPKQTNVAVMREPMPLPYNQLEDHDSQSDGYIVVNSAPSTQDDRRASKAYDYVEPTTSTAVTSDDDDDDKVETSAKPTEDKTTISHDNNYLSL